MKKAFLFLAASVLTANCGPRDVAYDENGKLKTAGTKVEVVEADGARATTCPQSKPDDAFIRIPETFDKNIYAGRVTAAFGSGDRNCLRIGAELPMQMGAKAPEVLRGMVRIERVEIMPISRLTEAHADAMGMPLEELKVYAETELDSFHEKVGIDPKGMASITFFYFIQNSKPAAPVIPKDIATFATDGERPTTCPADFTDSNKISSPEEKDQQILDGQLTAAMGAGDRSCFRIGTVVKLQNTTKEKPNAPVRAELKVVKVELVHISLLNESHAKALNLADVAAVKAAASAELKKVTFAHKDMVNITHFEVVPAE